MRFDKYLNTPIENLLDSDKIKIDSPIQKHLGTLHSSYFKLKMSDDYFSIQIVSVQVKTNDENIVESIHAYCPEIINENFYISFSEIYGKNHSVLKMDKLTFESKTKKVYENGNVQELAKREFSMKQVTFDNNPDVIMWQKHKNYRIEIHIDYKQNFTSICFRKKD